MKRDEIMIHVSRGSPWSPGLTVGLLVSGSGSGTAELLGLVSAGIGDEQRAVITDQDLLLRSFVHVFLIISHQRLGNGLTNGVYLSDVTAAVDANANIHRRETVLAQQQHGLLQLLTERARFDEVKRSAIDLDQAFATFAVRHGRRRLLTPEHLHRPKNFLLAHVSRLKKNHFSILYFKQIETTQL